MGTVSADIENTLRALPSVDQLLQRPRIAERVNGSGHGLVVAETRLVLDRMRVAIRKTLPPNADETHLIDEAEQLVLNQLDALASPSLRPVINATGVVLHTNLGRAPLSEGAVAAITQTARGFSNLEYDLTTGKRGKRDVHAGGLLEKLLGAPAIVVNNNAAAIFLVLNEVADGGEAIVSRGELIEIGDGFRIPDIMERSSAKLREVGTTNRTHISDYRNAINEATRLLMRVHPSNFRVVGFTARPSLEELVALGAESALPVMDDLGSGCLYDFAQVGFRDEPPVVDSLRAGADIVTFSGDKLLGGPQAGIIAGKPEWIARIRRNPLFRALRVDKLTYAALEATLRDYLFGRYDQIPVLRIIRQTDDEIRTRAERFIAGLELGDRATIDLINGESVLGGGSTPDQSVPTTLIRIRSATGITVADLESRLRLGNPAVIARIEDDAILLDLRTTRPEDETNLAAAVRSALNAE
jgi:L-seryl-tRNA(Ser) seleniumtransferase